MPSKIPDHHYGQALLDSVQHGSYPESEGLISAELPPSAIPGVLDYLEQARNDVKANIQRISKDSAQDIDGWISQAKQLRHDVELAYDTSNSIASGVAKAESIQNQISDAASKVALLEREVAFTETLIPVFERISRLRQLLGSIERAILENRTVEVADTLLQAASELDDIRARHNIRIAAYLKTKLTRLHEEVEKSLLFYWHRLLHVDASLSRIKVQQATQYNAAHTLSTISGALDKLGLLEDVVSTFCKEFDNVLLLPRLQRCPDGRVRSIAIDKDELKINGPSVEPNTRELFDNISELVVFLESHLPSLVLHRVSEILMPRIVSRVQSLWLSCAVPTDLEEMEALRSTVQSVNQFGNFLEKKKWPGKADFVNWAEDIPRFWLDRRREDTLNRVRLLLADGPVGGKTVERAETQFVSPKEGIFAGAEAGEDWNAGWSDDEGSVGLPLARAVTDRPYDIEGDQDAVAWGIDEVNNDEAQSQKPESPNGRADDTWGWGDDEEAAEAPTDAKRTLSDPATQNSNGQLGPALVTEREITLKETFSITSLPTEILDIVTLTIMDADLMKSQYSQSPIASAATGLIDLPRLVLTIYRASATASYYTNPSGNMLLYNDSLWLTERLQELSQKQAKTQLNIVADIQALSTFGRRAYGKEMESQRTILSDLLDGAQGFAHCTEPPFAQSCDLAIKSAVERLRDVHTQWAPILSHSALLQSLGSLLSTMTNKLIVDVEDMSDISEPESQRLADFCNRIASLEDLFLPQASDQRSKGAETVVPLTAVYTSGWLKFQYLTNILESSLVDIKFLWEEGELSMEFDVDELVELVEALFADSEHRRRAIGEMRRVSGSR